MMPDARFDSLIDQLAQAQATARTTREQGGQPVQQEVQASDPTGTVTARLDRDGRLAGLVVADGWLAKLSDVDGLQNAIVAAAGAALMQRWGFPAAPAEESPRSIEEINQLLDDAATQAVEVTQADREAVLERANSVVADLERAVQTMTVDQAHEAFQQQMDRLSQVTVELPPVSSQEWTNESRSFRLTITNGMLTGVELKRVWAEKQSGKSLTMALQSVLDENR